MEEFSSLWILFLEIGVALGLLIFVVWWTWPKNERRPPAAPGSEGEHRD